MKQFHASSILITIAALVATCAAASDRTPLRQRLQTLPFKIAYASYVNDNWEIFVINADGSNPTNLTQSPKVHEHYPQVSPHGAKTWFSVDEGEGRHTDRSLWIID